MGKVRSIVNLLEKIVESDVDVRDANDEMRVARRISRPYLEELKELAQDNALYLTNIYADFSSNRQTQLLICEALQHKPGANLNGFFLEKLSSTDMEFTCCAAIALGKTRCKESVHQLTSMLASETPSRLKYHLDFALLLLENSRGIDAFLDVLKIEQEHVRFRDGRIFAGKISEIFCVRISLILGALFDDFSPESNPFRWIEVIEQTGVDSIELDQAKIPNNLIEYHSPLLDN